MKLQIDRASAAFNFYMVLTVSAATKISNRFSVNRNVTKTFFNIDFIIVFAADQRHVGFSNAKFQITFSEYGGVDLNI